MPKRSYILTRTAESDFRSARDWSLKRWGKSITQQYFKDLHEGAESIAKNHFSLANSLDVTGSEELLVWPIREHYIVYLPSQNQKIIIVALIRQSRDVPAILGKNRFLIERELKSLGI
jgi:plasmid stabilization system protein ParE